MKNIEGIDFYKGWLYFAPIWISRDEEILLGRHVGTLLVPVAIALCQLVNAACSAIGCFHEPNFQIKITDRDW